MPDSALDLRSVIDESPVSSFQIRIFLICALVALFDGFDTQSIGYTAPLIAGAVHMPMSSFGIVFSVGLLGTTLGAFAFGPVADRYGRRWPMVAATSIFALFTLATAFVTSPGELLSVRFLAGLGLGGATPSFLALVAEYAPRRVRSLAVTAMYAAFPLGGLAGSLLASYLIPKVGWQSIFYIGGVAPMAISLLLIGTVPESLRFLVVRDAKHEKIAAIVRRIAPSIVMPGATFRFSEMSYDAFPVKALFTGGRSAATLLLWAPFFLGFMVLLTTAVWTPSVLRNAGMSIPAAALIMSSNYLGGVIGTASSGYLIDRFGAFRVLIPSFVLGGFSVAVFGQLIQWPLLLGISSAVLGLLVSGSATGLIALAANLYPTQMRSTGIGWAMGIGRFGQLAGPLGFGWMVEADASLGIIFVAASIPCFIAALFLALQMVVTGRRAKTNSILEAVSAPPAE